MPLVGILLSYCWKPLAVLGLLASLLAYRALLVHQRDEARSQVARLGAEAAVLHAANQALGATIDRQNAAVAELRARADAAANAMASNEEAASREGAVASGQGEQQARALIAAPIRTDSGCEGAIRWGNARAAELSPW
jgi:hypothetical protein